jgi:hypothetical protein
MVSAIDNRPRQLFWIILVAFVGWGFLYIFRTSFSFDGARVFVLWDDGMVSMRYARNLAAGYGAVWNPGGEHVQGYSNLGVMLLMALIHLLPLSPTRTSLLFQLFNLGLIVYCAFLVRNITRQLFDAEMAATTAAVVFMACGPIAVLSLQGTDVGVITTLLLVATRMVVTDTRDGGTWPTRVYAILAVGILMRLDFALAYVVFAAASVLFPRTRGSLALSGVIFATMIGGILGFQLWYYGDALPNTYYLKATGSPLALVLKSGLRQERAFVHDAGGPLALAAIALFYFQPSDRRLWLVMALPVVFLAYNTWIGGDFITSRFFAPALPLLIILTVGAWWRLSQGMWQGRQAATTAKRTVRRRLRMTAFVTFSAVSAIVFNSRISEWANPFEPTMLWDENVDFYRKAQHLAAHISKDATIAVHPAGIIPYFADRKAIDVLGKNDRHIAHMVVPIFDPAHSKWDWQYIVNEQRPDFIDAANRGLGQRADFRAAYYETRFDGLRLYVRKESARKVLDPSATFVTLE